MEEVQSSKTKIPPLSLRTGYRSLPFNLLQEDVFIIAGWSNKLYEGLEAIDNDGTTQAAMEAGQL